jgi:hypothetical protein
VFCPFCLPGAAAMWEIACLKKIKNKEVIMFFDEAEEALKVFSILEKHGYQGYILREPQGNIVKHS